MASPHELIVELIIDLIVAPMLTGLWWLFVTVNNRVVNQIGKGSKIEAHPWRVLIQMYMVGVVLALIHFYAR